MTTERTFDDLLAAVRNGDEAAANELFRGHQPRLIRYLRSQEPRVADDLAAEVWLAVAGQLDSFVGDEDGFRAWLFTIARRRVLDHRRQGARRRTSPATPEELGDRPDLDALDLGARSEAQEAIDLLSDLLPPEQAEVVILRVVADLDAEAVARIMGRTANWVRVTQHRALKKLAVRLRSDTDVTR